MPIYPGRTRGTWRVTIYTQGKQHEWSVPGTRREAQAFEARKRIELEAGSKIGSRVAPSLRDFCAETYQRHAKTHLKASTWHKVRRYQIATLCDDLGHLRLTELSVEEIDRYKAKRLATVHKGTLVKPSSVNNELRVLRTVLRLAVDMGVPCVEVKWKRLPDRGRPRVRVWTPEQVTSILSACQAVAPDLTTLLVFIYNTGCRKGEAIACEWSWVDVPGKMLRIPSNEVWQPKDGEPREVPLSRSLLQILKLPRKHDTFVFVNRNGERYAEFPKDVFSKVRAHAGLSGGPHTLRHSYASAFLARVPDMFLLAQILGHSTERVTELYSHLLPDHLSRARDAVDMAAPELDSGENSGEG